MTTMYHGTDAVAAPEDLKCVDSNWDDGDEYAFAGMWVAETVEDAGYYGDTVFAVTFDDPSAVEGDLREWRIHEESIVDVRLT